MYDTIIVGGPSSGLQLGALLSGLEGHTVLVLEKSSRLGALAYHLLDENMQLSDSGNVQAFLDSVAKIFQVDIRLNAIDWPENALWDLCSQICPGEIYKNQIISVEDYPAVKALKEKNGLS